MHDIHVNKLGFHMIFCIALKLVVSKYIIIQATKKIMCRAANNGRSTDNVQSKLVIDRTNPWIAGHLVQSFTDLFREILSF